MRKYVGVGILVLLVALGLGCSPAQKPASTDNAQAGKAAAEEEELVIPVQTELPHRENISSYFETTARVEAENRVQVMAESVGECEKVLVQEGDSVKVGDVLAELDKKAVSATIGQTEVQVRQSQTSYDIAERSLAEGIGAKAERDNARFAHEQALAALNTQKVQLSKLTIRAPINGIVTKKNVQEGQLVSAGMSVFIIVDPLSYMLVINPPEKELARLKVGQLAKVTVDALGSEEYDAALRRINPAVDSATGTVKVTLDFDPATRKLLRESAFARVRLVLDTHENALLVPKDALIEENARKYLFTVQQDTEEKAEEPAAAAEPASTEKATAEPAAAPESKEAKPAASAKSALVAKRLEIRTGLEDSKSVEVLEGLADNCLVVTLGQHTLKQGSKVTITNATDELLSKAGLSAEEALKTAKTKREGQKAKQLEQSHRRMQQHP